MNAEERVEPSLVEAGDPVRVQSPGMADPQGPPSFYVQWDQTGCRPKKFHEAPRLASRQWQQLAEPHRFDST